MLFAQKGFTGASTADIAAAAGISRRTLFRYFPSKFDIPWGRFEEGLANLRHELFATPIDLTTWAAITEGVVAFNSFPDEILPLHRRRMELILTTPELQAHAAIKHTQWRMVISEFVSQRLNVSRQSLTAIAFGHAALAMALSAYEVWLKAEDTSLHELLRAASLSMGNLCEIHANS